MEKRFVYSFYNRISSASTSTDESTSQPANLINNWTVSIVCSKGKTKHFWIVPNEFQTKNYQPQHKEHYPGTHDAQ